MQETVRLLQLIDQEVRLSTTVANQQHQHAFYNGRRYVVKQSVAT
ncbi:hypothetical protein [Spirosoma terrae]|nr:hypothetical protein [Spirosoma terrae]